MRIKKYFTGDVVLRDITAQIGTPNQTMYFVTFKTAPKLSRTILHKHTGDQILLGMEGRGSVEYFKKINNYKQFNIKRVSKVILKKDDIIRIPANTLHTHGSITSRTNFSHIAINIHSKSRNVKTTWYETDNLKITKIVE